MFLVCPFACRMAAVRRFAFRWSMLVRASQRLTGTPLAMLAARRSMWCSPLPHGRQPASRAVIAACQSMLAMSVVPSLMLVAVVMNWLTKSSRCSQLPLSIRRPTPASAASRPLAQANRASGRPGQSRGSFRSGPGGGGAACDVGECGHAELDRVGLALEGCIDLGELALGSGEADLQSLDLAEPAFPLGLGDPVTQIDPDFLQAGALGGVRPQE